MALVKYRISAVQVSHSLIRLWVGWTLTVPVLTVSYPSKSPSFHTVPWGFEVMNAVFWPFSPHIDNANRLQQATRSERGLFSQHSPPTTH